MAAIKLPLAEEALEFQLVQQPITPAAGKFTSEDDRPIAAESSSINTDYRTFDDEHCHDDAISAVILPASSDSSCDKDDEEDDDEDEVMSMLGLQSYWDAFYSEELACFRKHGLAGEIWFGPEVMDTVASWTKSLCTDILRRRLLNHENGNKRRKTDHQSPDLSTWGVLDLGTGNGLLLQELAEHGFSDLTGVDYCEGAIHLACGLAVRNGFPAINFLVDDCLETTLGRQFQLVMDKGTLDVIGLHPDGPIKRHMYWNSVSNLLASGGILVITSFNSTKDELVREVEDLNGRSVAAFVTQESDSSAGEILTLPPSFQYIDHVRSYPTLMYGGVVGSQVATVAFMRN